MACGMCGTDHINCQRLCRVNYAKFTPSKQHKVITGNAEWTITSFNKKLCAESYHFSSLTN